MLIKRCTIISILLLFDTTVKGGHDHRDHIKKEMEKYGIIPTILADAPHLHLHITYPNDKKVHLGNELTPFEADDEPQVKWESDPKKFYTLIMFDPDAPSKENNTFADVKHWLVVNILGGDLDTGDVIAEYFGPGPPKGTGLHRYIFLAYEQKERIVFDEPRSLKLSRAYRLKWSVDKFVKKYGLGEAVAADFFEAQWEAFVDERNKRVSNH